MSNSGRFTELRVRIDAEDKGDLALLRQSAADSRGRVRRRWRTRFIQWEGAE